MAAWGQVLQLNVQMRIEEVGRAVNGAIVVNSFAPTEFVIDIRWSLLDAV